MKSFGRVVIVLTVALLSQCVKGPTAADPVDHTPRIAVNLDERAFDSLVVQPNRVALVEFYLPGCAACEEVAWVIDTLAARLGDSVVVGAVNVKADSALAARYAVGPVPAFLLFRDGAVVERRSYLRAEPAMEDTLAALIRVLLDDTTDIDTTDIDTTDIDTTDIDTTNYLTLTTETFDTTVLGPGRVALVFFLYEGGAPCIYMDSVIRQIAPGYAGKAIVGKVHAWEESPLSQRYDIYIVPHFLFFKDNILVAQYSGIQPGDTLRAVLDRLLAEPIGHPVELDISTFDSLITPPGRITMVDFYSPYCGACMSMESIVDTLAQQFHGRALVGKVNVVLDDTVKHRYDIEWVPTFIFFDGGVEYGRIVGSVPSDSLAAMLESGLTRGN